jgi:uncharacterized peroxidase-related enzyme
VAHIEPVPREDLAQLETLFERVEEAMGFVPTSMFTMGHRPEILRGFAALSGAILGPGLLDRGLKQLIALMASTSAGCRYCQAHTSSSAARAGIDIAKVEAVFEFETSHMFTSAERAALRLARDAALQPNASTGAHFEELTRHYNSPEVVEIMATVSLFGFLNRWNDTMATVLEEEPLSFGSEHLSHAGWEPGKHAD